MAITDIFMPAPIARSTVDDVPLPQMQRLAPPPAPMQQQPSVKDMLASKGKDMAFDKAKDYAKDKFKSFPSNLKTAYNAFRAPQVAASADKAFLAANPGMAGRLAADTIAAGAMPGTAALPGASTLAGTLGTKAAGLTTAGGAGAMGALGTAVPYIGMGLLAGKAFGLFKRGGHVGPLALK